jgi:predicted metalloendopeptidase
MSIPQFYLEPRFEMQLAAYTQYMKRIVRLIARDAKSNQTADQLDKDVEDIIAFEKSFAKIALESLSSGNFSTAFRSSNLSDMNSYLPSVSLIKRLQFYNCFNFRLIG